MCPLGSMSLRRADTSGPLSAGCSGKSCSLRLVTPAGSAERGGEGARVSQRVRTSSGSFASLRVSLLMVTHVLRGWRRPRGGGVR
jgi:hypothetical protein